jgi:O-antigen/teichoic acid export membrane protein
MKIAVPLMFIIMASAEFLSSILNFSSPMALSLLALAIPFFIPMVIYRGLTQGLIDVPKIVLSIQSEWVIRLLGSILMWKMGFGLPGIAIAVALSIIAGFVFSTSKRDRVTPPLAAKPVNPLEVKALGATAMPYLILQMAQVLVLDSDIFVAKAVLSAETAGLVAGLLLIQRVFFFAFLSCSTILQPYVAKQKEEHRTPKELFTLLLAIGVITLAALVLIMPNSGLVVKIMLGDAYSQLSSIIWISALTGAIFIVSHLCAIYQIAKGEKFAAKLVLGFGLVQLISLTSVNHFFPEMGLHSYFSLKLAIQTLCAFCLIGVVVFAHKRALSER